MAPELDVMTKLSTLSLGELSTRSLSDLDQLLREVEVVEARAHQYRQVLQAELDHRYSARAQALRQEAGKSTGIVRLEDEGFVVIADLPKRAEYDQRRLKEAVEALRKWGEDPAHYVEMRFQVSETKYNAWPPAVRKLFEPARTLKTGRPTYRLERLDPSALPAAANDDHFPEVS